MTSHTQRSHPHIDGEAIPAAPKSANSRGAKMGIRNPVSGAISPLLTRALKAIFPENTWVSVEKLLYPGEDRERLVKHRLANARDYSVEELATMIRSEHGWKIIIDIMGEHRPLWFRIVAPLMAAAEAQRMQERARRKLARIVQEVADADEIDAAAVSPGSAALLLHDPDFYGARFAGHPEVDRFLGRSVAPPARRGRKP